MADIIIQLRKELEKISDPDLAESGKRFFKEEVKMYGTKTADVVKLAKTCFEKIKGKNKNEVFALCEELWKSGYMEESFIACNWSYFVHKDYEEKDIEVFEKWIENHVSNWATCDMLCNHNVGTYLEMYPKNVEKLLLWSKSGNRWLKRASAVSFIIPARKGMFLTEIFSISDKLLADVDDLVQKGYGWMLKAASQAHQKEVFDYVMKNKGEMPRTALRYAIEKMPVNLKKAAMEK